MKKKLNDILKDGKIIDNTRSKSTNMKDILNILSKNSKCFKCAVGYFYLEGLIYIINSLKDMKEIKILMGYETTRPTKEQLIRAFLKKINSLYDYEIIKPSIKLFYQLVKEYKTLKIRVYFGDKNKSERLHSKAYLFLRDNASEDWSERYKAGIIGSSNLTPSGLIGNTELNTIITDPSDLNCVEKWFEDLWGEGTEDFDKLKVSEIIIKAIEKSKFKNELKDSFLYINPKEFFKILIKFLDADYLFEEFKKSKLLQFQFVDFYRILNNFNSKGYRGCFLTSSVGLGKSYVASQVARYFLNNNKKVLLIAPAGLVYNKEQWPRYLKEFNIYEKVNLISMGKLQDKPEIFKLKKYIKNYSLIIVDEAHNFRNPDSNRSKNLKKIIDKNGNSKILFLTATPINTKLDNLLDLIKLFNRKGDNLLFDNLVRDLGIIINIFKSKDYEKLTSTEKEKLSRVQEELEKEMFVKSTREIIKTSEDYINELKKFAGIDIRTIEDPKVYETKYELDSKYKKIVNGIVNFINRLSGAHLRLLNPKRGARLSGFFKWLLYKRFESDITSYYLTLKRLSKKNSLIYTAVKNNNINRLDYDKYKENDYCEEDDNYEEDGINITFNIEFKQKLTEIIDKIKRGEGKENLEILEELKEDTKLINQEIDKLKPFIKDGSKLLFDNDQKIKELSSMIKDNKNKKLLIFTQYKDTLKAIKEYLKDSFSYEEIRFLDSTTKNKQLIIKKFNKPESKLRVLVSTDTLSEGYNISGADIVVNFDIPYNPVRIIQRIGRTTRLDKPKEIGVFNFRPDDSIDVELDLVKKMKLRIKDIIRFVGVEYRIWFEAEKELLSKRRKKDKKLYLEVLAKLRKNLRKGDFNKLEVSLKYSNPILIFLQKAIKKYNIKKEEVQNVKIPIGKRYTLLKGEKGMCVIYKDKEHLFSENTLLNKSVEKAEKIIDFESYFKQELDDLYNFKEEKKKERLTLKYFNDKIDLLVNNILDYITRNKLLEQYSNILELKRYLNEVKDNCGSTTEKILKKIKNEIKEASNNKVKDLALELKDSFRTNNIQKKLIVKKESEFAIGFLEE